MYRPALSIIVTSFNVEDTIEVTLRSLALQELDDYEVIVVEDASTDNSREIVRSWAAKYPAIVSVPFDFRMPSTTT